MDNFTKVLSNAGMWGAIIACVGIILIGYLLAKFNVFKAAHKGVLNNVVLKIALPALAFSGFMTTVTVKQLTEQGIVLGSAFAFYIVLNIIAMLWVKFAKNIKFSKKKIVQTIGGENVSESRALVIWMMLIFGSTTFFGLPIITAVYGTNGVVAANIWNIPYRIFLYSLAFMTMAGLKFNKENIGKSLKTALINPIVIATFLGLILWLSQLIPGASWEVKDAAGKVTTVGWFHLSKTAPWLEKIFAMLRALASPLIWLTIGITIAGTPIKAGLRNIWVWIFTALKLVLIPTIVLLMMMPFYFAGLITKEVASAMVIFAAVPPATVVIAYSMEYKNHEEYAAQCSAISTIVAIFTMPIWIVILGVIFV